MLRRTHKITPEQDAKIGRLARDMGIDKEEVVQLALDGGLAAVEATWEKAGKPKGLLAYTKALIELGEKSIKKSR